MPTYDYVCDACGHAFEEMQGFSEAPLRKCPACSKKKLRRLLGTGAALLFKGSGFYETDYRSDSYKEAVKADSDKTKAAEPKPAEAKPAATPAKAPKSGKGQD
jgi:putative FmdB family regulatory protein